MPRRIWPRTCTFAACDRPHSTGGLCSGHRKQRDTGKQLTALRTAPRRGRDLAARLAAYLAPQPTAAGCIEWVGARNEKGYGYLWNPITRRSDRAHRVAVLVDGRDIPAGMQVDHLCHNPACCNPHHLEVVTPEENSRRAVAYREARIADSITTRKGAFSVR